MAPSSRKYSSKENSISLSLLSSELTVPTAPTTTIVWQKSAKRWSKECRPMTTLSPKHPTSPKSSNRPLLSQRRQSLSSSNFCRKSSSSWKSPTLKSTLQKSLRNFQRQNRPSFNTLLNMQPEMAKTFWLPSAREKRTTLSLNFWGLPPKTTPISSKSWLPTRIC